MTKKQFKDVKDACVSAHQLFKAEEPHWEPAKPRWTKEAVWKRIRELERMPPRRTKPTDFALRWFRQPVYSYKPARIPEHVKAMIRLEYTGRPTRRKLQGLATRFDLTRQEVLNIVNGG